MKIKKGELRNPRAAENLIPVTKETASALGKRSGEVRRKRAEERRSMRYTLDILLTKPIRSGKAMSAEEIKDLAESKDLNVDMQTAINLAIIERAMLGDVQAAQYIRDTIGEKPSDKVEVDQSLTIEAWAKSHKPKL